MGFNSGFKGLTMFRDNLSSHHQGPSRRIWDRKFLPETSVINCHCTLRKISKESRPRY